MQIHRELGMFQDMNDEEMKEMYLRGEVAPKPNHLPLLCAIAEALGEPVVWVMLEASIKYGILPIDVLIPHPVDAREVHPIQDLISQD